MSEPENFATVRKALEGGFSGAPMDALVDIDADFNRLYARIEALESVLRAIRDECDDTGGEFWEGTNVETSDRMRALLGEEVDPPNE